MIYNLKKFRNLKASLINALPSSVAGLLRNLKRSLLNMRSSKAVFEKIADQNGWDGTDSVSGPGSSLQGTDSLRSELPTLLQKYKIQSLLDIPCGDAFWIVRTIPKEIDYVGADIVPTLIEQNIAEKGKFGHFQVLDLVNDDLPKADLIMVRDCFIHLPNEMVLKAMRNIADSGTTWMLTTHFITEETNIDVEIGGFRPVNLMRPPFNLPKPIELLDDFDGMNRNGKHLGLWRVDSI